MTYPEDFNKFYVNGVDMESDDYANVLNMNMPCSMSVCRRLFRSAACVKGMGCNLPKGFTKYLEYNKCPMPETTYYIFFSISLFE
ncbi:unnamed protein product [Caenorhabditis nigoni]